MTKQCNECGKRFEETANFCRYDGSPLAHLGASERVGEPEGPTVEADTPRQGRSSRVAALALTVAMLGAIVATAVYISSGGDPVSPVAAQASSSQDAAPAQAAVEPAEPARAASETETASDPPSEAASVPEIPSELAPRRVATEKKARISIPVARKSARRVPRRPRSDSTRSESASGESEQRRERGKKQGTDEEEEVW